jgi:hypothetical protein
MLAGRTLCFVALMPVLMVGATLRATTPATTEAAEQSMKQFLAQGDEPHAYRATRRLEARHGSSVGWLVAETEFAPATGFRYTITSAGGSDRIRDKVLKAVLDGERAAIASGDRTRATLAPCNYEFAPTGIDGSGLALVQLTPRRKDHALVDGTLFLQPVDGEIVRVKGRLAKSPSFWVKTVDIVRTYDRIADVVMPVALDSSAQLRMLGSASMRMTYTYHEIDGRPVQHVDPTVTARR